MTKEQLSVAIIGTGFSGICAAIQLKKNGFQNFKMYEKASAIGGTWRDNTYPGAACDVKSHLYSFSFEPNPHWSKEFSGWEEILNYTKHCIEKYDLEKHIQFNWEFQGAKFDEKTARWEIWNTHQERVFANAFVLGTGALHVAKFPEIKGIESFSGEIFHSSKWNHAVDLKNKKIAVIGTGASAIQFVPEIATDAARLVVYQRTPAWVLPKPNPTIPNSKKESFQKKPWLQKLKREAIYWQSELVGFVLNYFPNGMKYAENFSRSYLRKKLQNKELQEKLTPTYRMGCKRILLSSNYFSTFNLSQVKLETNPIQEIAGNKIYTQDGSFFEADVMICGTGFQVINSFTNYTIQGKNNILLNDQWAAYPTAFKGTVISNFPNLFLMTGPNTGLGHTSMIHIIESQTNYIIQYLETLIAQNAAYLNVKKEVESAYNQRLQEKLKTTVWASGCMSWYILNKDIIPTVWPGFTFTFRKSLQAIDLADFEIQKIEN